MERDATWLSMEEVAKRLSSDLPADETLEVIALRRSTGFLTITEGLFVGDKWTDVFEPVRKRRYFTKAWTMLQSIDEAANGIEIFLRERPDQT
jgi:hypothetical protein